MVGIKKSHKVLLPLRENLLNEDEVLLVLLNALLVLFFLCLGRLNVQFTLGQLGRLTFDVAICQLEGGDVATNDTVDSVAFLVGMITLSLMLI